MPEIYVIIVILVLLSVLFISIERDVKKNKKEIGLVKTLLTGHIIIDHKEKFSPKKKTRDVNKEIDDLLRKMNNLN